MRAHGSSVELPARLLAAALGLSAAATGVSRAAVDPAPIVAGLGSVVSTGAPGPLFWVDPEVVPIVAGDEDTPVPRTFAVARGYGLGRVVALGHDGLTPNADFVLLDNRRFVIQALEWLDVGHGRALAITCGHGETLGFSADSLRAAAVAAGWSADLLCDSLDAGRLGSYSVVIYSNGVGLPPTAAEREALRAFVEAGGGLFLQGLGWSYVPYHPGTTLDDYPMNQLALPFGIRWIDGSIDDPTDRYAGSTRFHRFHPDLPPPAGVPEALDLMRSIGTAHGGDLPTALEADAALRARYVDSHLMIVVAERNYASTAPEREGLYLDYREALEDAAPWFRKQAPYDASVWPTMTRLRERAARTLADAAPLTPLRRQEIGQTLGLEGTRAALWLDHGLLLLDDGRLDGPQTGYLRTLMDSIPPAVHDLRSIAVSDFLPGTTPPIPLDGVGAGGVNIFGSPIGAGTENPFPDDAPPAVTDLFCLVAAHEVNHVVDAWMARNDPRYRAQRDSILARAGPDPMNYCRSMGQWGGFQGAGAVEFFAGHAGQWFTHSARMMDLGISRFEGGRPCPIEDPCLFAEVYSEGGPFTRFFETDVEGNLETRRVPVGRDPSGRITDLWYDGKHVHLDLAADGRVVAVGHAVAGAVPPPVAAPRLRVWPNPARGEAWVEFDGETRADARVALFDLSGRRIAAGIARGAGLWRISFTDPRRARLRAGLYLVRLEGGGRTLAKRLAILP